MQGYGEPPSLPSLGPMEYLGRLFVQMGKVHSVGMGQFPVPWSEVEAFGRIMGLDREDVLALRAMSSAYVEGYAAGADALRLPPWNGEPLWPKTLLG